jgi:hypothetical protein
MRPKSRTPNETSERWRWHPDSPHWTEGAAAQPYPTTLDQPMTQAPACELRPHHQALSSVCCQLVPEIGDRRGRLHHERSDRLSWGLRLHSGMGRCKSEARPAVAATAPAETGRAEVAVTLGVLAAQDCWARMRAVSGAARWVNRAARFSGRGIVRANVSWPRPSAFQAQFVGRGLSLAVA